MSRPRSISDIAPIAITNGNRQVRVELAAGQVFIHITPDAICSHCGHKATIFVAQDGWSPCARCYNTLQLYTERTSERVMRMAKEQAEAPVLARPFLMLEKAVQA
jgi:hypothetical protein